MRVSGVDSGRHACVTYILIASAVWSACYGTQVNQELVLKEGGIVHLVKHLLGSPSADFRYSSIAYIQSR